jgi:hypothetical protein
MWETTLHIVARKHKTTEHSLNKNISSQQLGSFRTICVYTVYVVSFRTVVLKKNSRAVFLLYMQY